MGVFNAGGVGFDLGSSNVTIYLENEGIVLREASYLLTSADDSMDILAVGRDARAVALSSESTAYVLGVSDIRFCDLDGAGT